MLACEQGQPHSLKRFISFISGPLATQTKASGGQARVAPLLACMACSSVIPVRMSMGIFTILSGNFSARSSIEVPPCERVQATEGWSEEAWAHLQCPRAQFKCTYEGSACRHIQQLQQPY